jgi:hypothetical protein
MKAPIAAATAWYSAPADGATLSGVLSLGGVGGNEKMLCGWPGAELGDWDLSGSPPPNGTQPEWPRGFAPSDSHGWSGAWKCGRHTCPEDILDAATKRQTLKNANCTDITTDKPSWQFQKIKPPFIHSCLFKKEFFLEMDSTYVFILPNRDLFSLFHLLIKIATFSNFKLFK